MVRETRHLWVGNLPDNIREERIREHFKRYGRVQNVKLLGRAEVAGPPPGGAAAAGCGVCATVAFMDIKSASKAHTAEHVLDERTLTTEYYEPAAIIPSSAAAAGGPSAGSSPAGSGYSGSSSSVNSAPAPPTPTASTRYHHLSGGEESSGTPPCAAATAAAPATWRGTNDSATEFCRRGNTPAAYQRYQRNSSQPYSTPPSNVERTPHQRWYASGSGGGGESTPSTPGGATEGGTRRRRRSGSGGGSSRSDTSSPEPSDESRASTPQQAGAPAAASGHPSHRPSSTHQWASTASGRPLAICVRNLPTRSTDSSLKDGLYHEYKKHGKVVWVKVVGQSADRYAIVRFKKPSDVEKALEVSQDKLFFGCKISVAPHQSCEEDAESAKPYETDIDEYHPKATRTLFIGNLEKDVTQQQLRDKFKHFGRIIEIDIKKGSGGGAGYAFCQYASISSVVEAIRAMDGEYVGSSRVKLGFGKPVATTCVWVDGLTEHTEKQVLGAVSRCGAATSVCVDRAAGAALVHFEQAAAASAAVRELRRVAALASAAAAALADTPRLAVDYASRECQEAFYEQLEKHGGTAALAGSERLSGDLSSRYMPPTRHDALRYDGAGPRSRASSYGRSSSRTPRYSALEHFDPVEYAADRRYRVYDELGSSPQTDEPPYEDRLQSVVVSPHRARRHRRDSTPGEHKHPKQEWHRSVSGGIVSVVAGAVTAGRRSRSGSRRRHRKRREESCSRGGTPLRDEPAPTEPRRAPLPRDRSVPMSLPLPKFALLLRAAPAPPPPAAPPAPAAPASPRPERRERPPSASSSSAGSAPHSPSMSLEERIRSLDEKYERWSRLDPPAPPPARPRHRLLEVDIHEVKPSDVVRSLLAKRSVFDEDSERLEGTVLTRPPSPGSDSPRRPRALQYPFPTHPVQPFSTSTPPAPPEPEAEGVDNRVPPNGMTVKPPEPFKSEKMPPEPFRPTSFSFGEYSSVKNVDYMSAVKSEQSDDRSMRTPCRSDSIDKPSDPRLNRIDRSISSDRLNTFSEIEYKKQESRIRLRTPSTDKPHFDTIDKKLSPKTDKNQAVHASNDLERDRRRSSVCSDKECDKAIESLIKEDKEKFDRNITSVDFKHKDIITQEVCVKLERTDTFDCHNISRSLPISINENIKNDDELKVSNSSVEILDDNLQQQKKQDQLSNSKEKSQEVSVTIKQERNKDDLTIETPEQTQASIDEEIAKICEFHSSQDETSIIRTPSNTPPIEPAVLFRPEPKKRLNFDKKNELSNEIIENQVKRDPKTQDEEKNKFDGNKKKNKTESFDFNHDFLKHADKNGKERFNSNVMITAFQDTKLEKENIEFEKTEKDKHNSSNHTEKRIVEQEKHHEGSSKTDRERSRHYRDERRMDKEKHDYEKERGRSVKHEKDKLQDKSDKDKKIKEETHILETKLEKVKPEKESENELSKQEKETIKTEKELNKSEREPSKTDKETVKLEKELHKSEKEPSKTERDSEKSHKEKNDRDCGKDRHAGDKSSRHEHHRKEKYDKRKDSTESNESKVKKDDKHKHERHRKEHSESKRDQKKESDSKSRKSSRDESIRDLCRKDSTDSSTSRASYDSTKIKELDTQEVKEENKGKSKSNFEYTKQKIEKEPCPNIDHVKTEESIKIKNELKEDDIVSENLHIDKLNAEKVHSDRVQTENAISDQHSKRNDFTSELITKVKTEVPDKTRHYSLDSPTVDNKRKERVNSCSSLPSHIGYKRRMSSQDSLESLNEESKKVRNELKPPDRRDSKDSRNTERHKTPKFNKGHFAKLLESKTKDEKKNQVKQPDDNEYKDEIMKQEIIKQEKDSKTIDKGMITKKSHSAFDFESDKMQLTEIKTESLQNDLDFLETLKLEAKSEEDEKQKALRREMKEKKRLQQLQQIQELQMQQETLQQADYMNKLKDDKKNNRTTEEKRKEAAREKRMSTDRKSRDEKSDNNKSENKRRNRNKQVHSSDTSDSDEPKKHSIFDIVDDGPTYISMYDKVKARSCKNMQKQEEEKRQEKIKAKFSQLKQSRAKREEKKRSSWDEDSDSEHDRKKPQKLSMDSSTDDDQHHNQAKNRDKLPECGFDNERKKTDYYSTEEESRNKMSRKNSRSRIMSDTSDDDTLKRLLDKSPSFSQIKKELSLANIYSDESIQNDLQTSGPYSKTETIDSILRKQSTDRIKKNSLLNLFGKSDSDDSKIKSCPGEISADYKSHFVKKSNDFSSGSESITSNIYSAEIRKKHKKKQRRNKMIPSDDEKKLLLNDLITGNLDLKHRHDKSHRHNTKKDKRREKTRESVDTDESRDERSKHRKIKNSAAISLDFAEGNVNNAKKDGKMEDIFGPLSDESDSVVRRVVGQNMCDFTGHDFDTNYGVANHLIVANADDTKPKEKDENKRRREKKRKEKRHFMKEDENSLDLDAASKAIEAQLCADNLTDDDIRQRCETIPEPPSKKEQSDLIFNAEEGAGDDKKNHERSKKDNKERKKKKKRSREDRQMRKEHHHFHHHDKISYSQPKQDLSMIELSDKESQQENPAFPDSRPAKNTDKCKETSPSDSPSLPLLTETPPKKLQENTEPDVKNISSDASGELVIVEDMEISCEEKKESELNRTQTNQPVKTPEYNLETSSISTKTPEKFIPAFASENDQTVSDNAVRSISNLDKETPKVTDTLDTQSAASKVDEKLEEKPRAVISQEETEDAVAALLGESFGGNDIDFSFDDNDQSSNPMESTAIENDNMPEEDAEEMRRAVQNLNASEMETKPDTPMSDNDLLLIDTDNEEVDETQQDVIEKIPASIITTNPNINAEQRKTDVGIVAKSKPEEMPNIQPQTSAAISSNDISNKFKEKEFKQSPVKRDVVHPMTSAPTPVITSWTLSNNKLREPQLLNISKASIPSAIDSKNITASIIQLKAPPAHNMQHQNPGTIRPVIGPPNRMSAPYQVLNQMIRSQVPNMQPPTIKIPDSHFLYQKQQNIVLSPRMAMDPRMHSPKSITQGEGMTSPRLTNMTILTTSHQNMNSVGLASPNNIPQRSPGHVTVVRMQQPPLSPIQAMHLPHGNRTMVSPSRPNSVLVQTTGTSIHFNRLPVAPVLAPISKQMNPNNIAQQNKDIRVVTSQMMHHQKNISTDCRKNEPMTSESSKLILSPTNLQQSTNPTVMAQNRLISMQNALHVANINSTLKLSSKVLLNNVPPLGERKDPNVQFRPEMRKSEQHNHIPYGTPPIIHVAGINHSSGHIIQSCSKPIMIHDPNNSNREQGSNVIHSISSPRLLTAASISNVLQIDANKVPTSVLSMSALRSPTVLTRLDTSRPVAATTSTLTNVVMTPLLLKSNAALGTVRINNKAEPDHHTSVVLQNTMSRDNEERKDDNTNKLSGVHFDSVDRRKELLIKPVKSPTPTAEIVTKCETDFEELLKDNTNEIKITNDGEKKLEVNVGKTVTTVTTNIQQFREHSTITQNRQVNELTPVSKPNESVQDSKIPCSVNPISGPLVISKEEPNQRLELNMKSIEVDKQELLNIPTDANKNISENLPANINSNGSPKSIASSTNFGKILENNGSSKNDDKSLTALLSEQSNDSDIMKKQIDESDSWTAKDVNIESVIKKVDSLCSDNIDENNIDDFKMNDSESSNKTESPTVISDPIKPMDTSNTTSEENMELSTSDEFSSDRGNNSKRGGRNARGKKSSKNQDRVQTRQIAKPPRGAGAKRGRGRANTDKKIKNAINASANNLPGDVYDFHEDSGDEGNPSSNNKSEARPRLILTIKSPLTGQTPAIASSSLSITTPTVVKDQVKQPEKSPILNKDEKMEEFVSPSNNLASNNTRKSRRLLEKVVERSTVDDVIEDVVKGTATSTKGAKDPNKKRAARQAGGKVSNQDKGVGSDARKSPRGVKRTRDRSSSDASLDSSDEKTVPKKDEAPKEAKIPKVETPMPPVTLSNIVHLKVVEPELPKITPAESVVKTNNAPPPVINTPPAATPTPIMKPPKKMILASAFEATASPAPIKNTASPIVAEKMEKDLDAPTNKVAAEADELSLPYRDARNLECAKAHSIGDELMPPAATAEARPDPGFRRLIDAAPGNALPVGALEAADARVQSPALPHRPPSIPSIHRPADRATPVLMRAGEGGAHGYRPAYAGTASLPRGAHHPPAPQPPHPAHPHLKPQHHHPGTAARMNVTSVPHVSPQGQIGLGEGMYPHFSRQHYQMFQQHFHATQHENRVSPLPYTRSLEAEGSEAPTPPLELRRPPSARVPRPAHSPAPADRLIMYGVVGGRSPPPAHAGRPPSALPPPGPPGPPHASQVPREADSLQMLLRRYPVMWQGLLALKNDSAAVQMHFVGGNPNVAGNTLPRHTDGSTPPLRIAQRMRLEPTQLEQVHRKMKMENEHCTLLALPCGRDHMDVLQQSTNLTAGFITYLQQKQAAGIVNVAPPGHHQAMYTVHIFPSCDFANENLNRIAPDLMHRVADIAHLLIVIATV